MADTFKGIITADGKKRQLPYGAVLETPVSDKTLSEEGGFADSKVVGDKFAKVDSETASLKEDFDNVVTKEEQIKTLTIQKNTDGIELKDSYCIGTDGDINSMNSYYTYIYKIPQNGFVYFADTPTNSNVLMFGIYNGYPSKNTFKGTRYSSLDNNIPKKTNKIVINAGDYVAISVYLSVTVSNLYFALYEDYTKNLMTFGNVSLNFSQIESANKKQMLYVRYSESEIDNSTEKIEVYVPTKNGFIRYDVLHCISIPKNANVWRMGYAYFVDNNFENPVVLTVFGEWECALHLDNNGDYIGGITHGNEILNQFALFIDGVYSDITTYKNLTQVTTVKIVSSTNMYDPTDSSIQIAERGCERAFSSDGLTIKQTVTWSKDVNTTWCYMAMNLPLKTMVEKVYDNTKISPSNISYGTFSDITDITLYKDGGITNNFAIYEYPRGLTGGNQLLIADNGGNPYCKCYYVITNGTTVTSGTIWRSESHYKFDK